jgi:uncharacterized protein YifN (PemK superfamily)
MENLTANEVHDCDRDNRCGQQICINDTTILPEEMVGKWLVVITGENLEENSLFNTPGYKTVYGVFRTEQWMHHKADWNDKPYSEDDPHYVGWEDITVKVVQIEP